MQQQDKKNIINVLLAFLVIVSIFFIVKIVNEVRSYKFIGEPKNIITFNGQGEVSAIPDVANISFSVRKEAKTLKLAQNEAADIVNKALKFLKDSGVSDKDIKTISYNSYPKYDYDGIQCLSYPCPVKKPVLTGYEVSQMVSVKIRNINNIGNIIGDLGNFNIAEINGPDFVIDKEEELKAEARRLAIKDAKEKAENLVRDLGVKLVRIVNFSETENYPYPVRYDEMMSTGAAPTESATVPELPAVENKITSNVTITYEIR